ncbi:helicase [Sporosarcina sp. Te-1]|uniref:helicase n=1 Tax=Sporosarcina sp. Te-1 TaxID=2818390 RepID=UPI001A9CFBEA|nr:helicase [Sporosarcina sp. Te-1]QTD41845.1 helicase [Sporosarcina sp. Te-1]
MSVYPNCPMTIRNIQLGGLTKLQLLERLEEHAIHINELGDRLLADKRFIISDHTYQLVTVELRVKDLGLNKGAALDRIFHTAKQLGLQTGPFELGPHIRLAYLNQPEGFTGKPTRTQRAPFGSITIASEIMDEDDEFPKGFYIRCIEGELWLRGYVVDNEHIWDPDDRFVFCQSEFTGLELQE